MFTAAFAAEGWSLAFPLKIERTSEAAAASTLFFVPEAHREPIAGLAVGHHWLRSEKSFFPPRKPLVASCQACFKHAI